MGAIEWVGVVIVAAVALVATAVGYRRWRTRRVAELIVGHTAGLLFELARVDGTENAAECACIVEHTFVVCMAVTGQPAERIDTDWLGRITWRAQQSGISDTAKHDFLV